jgi:branched-chain amino acid transport system ATP-binding protein
VTAVLELVGVSKQFGTLTVLDSLSVSVARDSALGVVGPNGAGKTTMLNILAGDLAPTHGTVLFDGVDITQVPSHQRSRNGIGRTSQIPRPFEGLTVYENVLVGATFGRDKQRTNSVPSEACLNALERVGMTSKANVLAGKLTLLERKRLELARALALEPSVLLLDEIAGGLTEMEMHELVDTIKSIRASGVTLVWIEHIVHALLAVVDQLLAIDYGRMLMCGDPRTVMSSPEVQAVYMGTN